MGCRNIHQLVMFIPWLFRFRSRLICAEVFNKNAQVVAPVPSLHKMIDFKAGYKATPVWTYNVTVNNPNCASIQIQLCQVWNTLRCLGALDVVDQWHSSEHRGFHQFTSECATCHRIYQLVVSQPNDCPDMNPQYSDRILEDHFEDNADFTVLSVNSIWQIRHA